MVPLPDGSFAEFYKHFCSYLFHLFQQNYSRTRVVARCAAELAASLQEKKQQQHTEKAVQPKSSKVWEHFTLNLSKKWVTCKLCKTNHAWDHHGNERTPETKTCWSHG